MTKKAIILTTALSFLGILIVGSLSFVGFSNYYQPQGGNIDVLDITDGNISGSFGCYFGIVQPGESKEQRIKINSLSSVNLDYAISFIGDEEGLKVCDLITAKIETGNGEKVYSSILSECINKEAIITRSLGPSSSEDLIFSYQLKEDIPEELIGKEATFSVSLSATLFK